MDNSSAHGDNASTTVVPVPSITDEEFNCPRCGYSLRGLPQLRCPECGLLANLDQLRAARELRSKPLFEYQWRRRPVRSFVRTAWLTVRPWRLWREVKLEWEPRPVMIWVYGILSLLLLPVIGSASGYGYWLFQLSVLLPIASSSISFAQANKDVLRELSWMINFLPDYIEPWLWGTSPFCLFLVFHYLGCQFYHRSLLRFRIKSGHLVRLVIYSSGTYWLGLMYWLYWAFYSTYTLFNRSGNSLPEAAIINQGISVTITIGWIASLIIGARLYLQIKRGWLMLLSAGLFALVATFCTYFFVIQLFERDVLSVINN
ncbi:MAG: hypothetical protein HJJLKODD_00927 [Phycisphaerae bacterium]|nr:hypothetical protein [Phycisphaerae bacterium]